MVLICVCVCVEYFSVFLYWIILADNSWRLQGLSLVLDSRFFISSASLQLVLPTSNTIHFPTEFVCNLVVYLCGFDAVFFTSRNGTPSIKKQNSNFEVGAWKTYLWNVSVTFKFPSLNYSIMCCLCSCGSIFNL